MTDKELGKAIIMQCLDIAIADEKLERAEIVTERVGRFARELCGPTASERRVIEAAEEWTDFPGSELGSFGYRIMKIADAVHALRAERAPKPRYQAREGRVWDAALGAWLSVGVIAARLNAAEQR